MLTLLRQPDTTKIHDMPLDEHMTFLIRYGRPRLSYIDNGWYCTVEMNTNTTGTQFNVASEFYHKNPNAAVKQCHERIDAALNQLKVTITK
jgi:hypothetical protein